MTDELAGYYRDGNGVLKQNQETIALKSQQSPLYADVLEKLDHLDKDALIKLIHKVSKAGWGVVGPYGVGPTGADLIKAALMSDDELYDEILLRGKALCLTATDRREYTQLATFIAERMKGKPTQAINTTVTIGLVEIMDEIAKRRKAGLIDVTPKITTSIG